MQTKENKTFLSLIISHCLKKYISIYSACCLNNVAEIKLKSGANHIPKIDSNLTEFTKAKVFEKFTIFIERKATIFEIEPQVP